MTMYSLPQPPPHLPSTDASPSGSKDGNGWADCDTPYTFGRRPRAVAPFPFTPLQFGHLLALRGRVADGLAAADDLGAHQDVLVD